LELFVSSIKEKLRKYSIDFAGRKLEKAFKVSSSQFGNYLPIEGHHDQSNLEKLALRSKKRFSLPNKKLNFQPKKFSLENAILPSQPTFL
jgi:hypothetical protein